ncbi:hypothetical protein [Mucilaginibacter paludis]|uniref:Uncharacterized protein n=1 Tax=Mucilaginibacter paludis DSM 18603 TaxID=714943 RepID=H1YED0_9SPHI|nr:hypothetical protein [Mucilaginibacter paludis]EHQ27164.1 hypothetical protein Mucpa_3060 [Mucilaginibacter paludis DSM 18603]
MKSWKTPLIYCVSLMACFVAGIAIDLACGGEVDPYDYYVSFFHNNVQGGKDNRPFYFTSYQFLYDNKEPLSEADVNAGEWAAYFGKDVSADDVARAMYHLDAHTEAALAEGYLKTGEKLPDTLSKNTFLRALLLKKNSSALKYYRFAKSAEKLANTGFDQWNPTPIDTIGLLTAGNTALKNALLEKDKFIQLRYFYQAQRLMHYGKDYTIALRIYDKYIAAFASQSHVRGWALALKAGEKRWLKDTVQAAYLFSRIFDEYPERRVQAYQNYKYIHVTSNKPLALCTNNNERASIYAIEGFGNPDLNLEYLQQVYHYAPSSATVGVLLVREINKLEEGYLTHKLLNANTAFTSGFYTERGDQKQPGRLIHMAKLIAFCKQLVAERKYPDYNIGNLAGAYLAWMESDNANGFAWLRALNNEQLSPAMNDQKEIIRLLLISQNIQKLNEINEAQLLPALKWLDEKTKAEVKRNTSGDYIDNDDHKFAITARNFYQQILAPAYLQQGDTTRAALALFKSAGDYVMTDFWENNLHSSQISRLIRWKKTPPAVPYLNFLASKLNLLKLNYLNELLGTAYLREHRYGKAIAAFKLVDVVALNKYPDDYYKGDPFIDRINDYPKVLRYGKTKGFNKLQFAMAMNTLEQKIKTDTLNAPSYYYRYATGLYNTSHYGNAWYLISYTWSSADFGRQQKYSYDTDYVKTENAEKYYLLARSLSNNEEFKAKCTFMAAKCRQKQAVIPNFFMTDYTQAEKKYLHQLRSSQYFDELKDKYRKTAIYKKAIGECSYLKDFVLMSQ